MSNHFKPRYAVFVMCLALLHGWASAQAVAPVTNGVVGLATSATIEVPIGWQRSAELVIDGRDVQGIAQLAGRVKTMTTARVSYSLSRELQHPHPEP